MINRFIFSQKDLDSGSLTVLASVAHRFSEIGVYYAKIRRGENEVGRFKIVVDESVSAPQSVKVDLKALDLPVSQQSVSERCGCFNLNPNGYAVFVVSTGAGGYVLEIEKSGSECGRKEFDNRELLGEDLFVATLLRPGTYRVVNALTKAEAKLSVVYPELGKTPRFSQPVNVECTEKAITPSKIVVNPGQGVVFCLKVPSRLKIELTQPEDRPKQGATARQAKQAKTRKGGMAAKQVMRRLKLNPV
jgi:hypothetical protein